jgi:hypothetical protein
MKKLFIIILIIAAIPLVTALFVPKSYVVERELTVAAPRTEVFDFLRLLKNQDAFSVWAEMDPYAENYYEGTDGTVGFVSGWRSDSANVGHGEQEITAIEAGSQIDYELRFFKPFESTSQASILTSDAPAGGTRVQWSFQGKMSYPTNLLLLFMDMEEMLGKDLQGGLDKLKQVLETRAQEEQAALEAAAASLEAAVDSSAY